MKVTAKQVHKMFQFITGVAHGDPKAIGSAYCHDLYNEIMNQQSDDIIDFDEIPLKYTSTNLQI